MWFEICLAFVKLFIQIRKLGNYDKRQYLQPEILTIALRRPNLLRINYSIDKYYVQSFYWHYLDIFLVITIRGNLWLIQFNLIQLMCQITMKNHASLIMTYRFYVLHPGKYPRLIYHRLLKGEKKIEKEKIEMERTKAIPQ